MSVAGSLLEDQYFASPKRKDCRLMKVSENGQLPETTLMDHKGHHKDNKAGRTIGKCFCFWLLLRLTSVAKVPLVYHLCRRSLGHTLANAHY